MSKLPDFLIIGAQKSGSTWLLNMLSDHPEIYLHREIHFFNSDFNYRKLQLYFRKPIIIGPIGRLQNTVEIGKTFGNVPLALISVIPGNQSYFKIENNFNLLNYYEFISDTYISAHIEHNFNGKILRHIKKQKMCQGYFYVFNILKLNILLKKGVLMFIFK